jgi:curved DNA-binding protein CbpA
LEESKAADAGELKAIDDKLSSHVLQLSWIKEKLEAEVNFMRSRGAYTTLGVGPEASDAELARAYKVQALRLHPDRGGSTEAFQALQSAYERILKQRGGEGKKKTDGKSSGAEDDPVASHKAKDSAAADIPSEDHDATSSATEAPPVAKDAAGVEVSSEPQAEQTDEVGDSSQSAAVSNTKAEMADAEETKESDVEETKETKAEMPEPKEKEEVPEPEEKEEVSESAAAEAAQDEQPVNDAEQASRKNGAAQSQPLLEGLIDDSDDDDDDSDGEAADAFLKKPYAEGLDASDSEEDGDMDPEEFERILTNAAAAIPAEVAAEQADMALQGAHMCFRAVRLCSRAASLGGDAWPQLERLSSHVLEASQHVAEACGRISNYAGSTPSTVMPLLDSVSKRSSFLKESMVRQAMKGTTGLLQVTEKVSSMAKEVSLRQSLLIKHATAVLDMLHGLIGRMDVPASVCDGMADCLETVARLAREAAEAGAAAATAVGEAQRHAQNLVEVLGAAGLWEKIDAETKSDQDKKAKRKDGDEAPCEESSDEEKEPWEQHAEWVFLLQKLNGEVGTLQQELRGLVSTDPALIQAVNPPQKEALFAIVAELLAHARHAASRAWYAQWLTSGDPADEPATFPDLVETALAFISSASSWERIAVPSIDARLIRLAALVDSVLLCTMMQEDLFQHTLQLASKEDAPLLEARFAAIVQAIKMGFVSA